MIENIVRSASIAPLAYRVGRWHARHYTGGSSFPISCGLYINTKCNFRCEFCNIWRIDPPYVMPEEEARELIRQLGDLGAVYFSISGGEPLMVPYVIDLLGFAKQSGILYTHVVSNGFLMDVDRAKELATAQVSEVSFSLDGPEAVHNEGRGAARSYEKLLTAVENVKAHAPETKIVLNTILKWKHPDHALHAVDVARATGVYIKIQPENSHPVFDNQSNGLAIESDRVLDRDEQRALTDALDIFLREPCVVNTDAFIKDIHNFLYAPHRMTLAGQDCVFGYHHVEFFGGLMFPCLEGTGWRNGFDWLSTSVKDVFQSKEYQDLLTSLKKCQGCLKNYYVCYYEPRLNFPLNNFVRSRLAVARAG